jgi:hypothetical protein
MGYCEQVAAPTAEPVDLQAVLSRLRLPSGSGDAETIQGLISSVREDAERLSGLTLAQRQFSQILDSFPYFTDTIQSQQAYPPSYYSLPRYSSTLWNYSQMIKLARTPLISVDSLTYIGTDGNSATLQAGVDFIVDPETKLARIFPMVGGYWPSCLYTPNAVQIVFTAGYDPDPTAQKTFTLPSPPPSPPNQQTSYQIAVGIPYSMVELMKSLVVYRYQYPAQSGMPPDFERAFQALGIMDFSPTRG